MNLLNIMCRLVPLIIIYGIILNNLFSYNSISLKKLYYQQRKIYQLKFCFSYCVINMFSIWNSYQKIEKKLCVSSNEQNQKNEYFCYIGDFFIINPTNIYRNYSIFSNYYTKFNFHNLVISVNPNVINVFFYFPSLQAW